MKRAAVFFGLAFFLIIISQQALAAGGLNCTIQASSTCPAGFTKILGLENETGGQTNAHAQNHTLNTYANSLCCESTLASVNISNNCNTGATIVRLSSDNNAHVQTPESHPTIYNINTCLDSTKRTPSFTYPTGACTNECLMSMASSGSDNKTNAHVAICSQYSQKVCGSLTNAAPTLQSSLIGAHLRTPYNTYFNSLVAYWQFEGDATDSAGTTDGTLNGPTNTSEGRVGNAFEFDGTDDYIGFGDNLVDGYGSITVAAWIKPTINHSGGTDCHSGATTTGQIFDKAGSSDDNLAFCLLTDNNLGLYLDNGADRFTKSNKNISVNQWTFVVGTYNGSHTSLYINGALDNSNSTGTGSLITNTNPLSIGARPEGAGGRYFNGTIDEPMIFNRSLNATEVKNLYNETAGNYDFTTNKLGGAPENATDGDQDSLTHIFNWKVNGDPITVLNMPFDTEVTTNDTGAVKDYSGLSNHGTLGGGNNSKTPSWIPNGIRGGAHNFDINNGEYINISDDPSLDFPSGQDFTLEIWFKTSHDYSGQKGVLISKNQGTGRKNYFIEVQTDNALRAQAGQSELTIDLASPAVNDGSWHHAVLTLDDTGGGNADMTLYLDGNSQDSTSGTYSGNENAVPLRIGENGDLQGGFSTPFNGSIDEVRIYNRSLSQEQIQLIYNNGAPKYNELASNETQKGENWTVEVTTNDASNDSTTLESSILYIQNSAPTQVSLLTPPDQNTTWTDRPTLFNWTDSTDHDGDTVTYRVQVSLDESFTSIVEDQEVSDSNFTAQGLSFDTYWWRVYANDTEGDFTLSETFNFTLVSLVDINLTTSAVEFGTVSAGSMENTSDDSPPPFVIQNNGNIEVNLTINGTEYFQRASLGTDSYQFKAAETAETGSFNTGASLTTYTNMTATPQTFLRVLNYSDANDEAEIDILVRVPGDEPQGTKTSTVTVEGSIS